MAQIIFIAGIIVVALVLIQGLLFVMTGLARSQRENERNSLSLQLLDEQIAAVREEKAKKESEVAGWNGWRKFEVAKRQLEPGDICSFYLVPHDHKPIPGFNPGQYLTFNLNIPGDSKPTVRCYSLSDGPRDDYYRVSIKRVPPPRDKPDVPPGKGSNFFHDHIQEGEIIDVKAPGGHFFLDINTDHPIVLIGGGIGITPVLSMLNALVYNPESGNYDKPLTREVYFVLGVRSSKDHPMKEHVEMLDKMHDRLHVHVCYSRPGDDDKEGVDYQHAGRVNLDLFKKILPSNNFQYYMCGPPPFMEAIVPALEEWGVPEKHIHYEAFGPATVKKVKKEAPKEEGAPAADGFEVEFAKSGKKCKWTPDDGPLLDFAEENDIAIDFGCRAGGCGTCIVAIKSGDVHYETPPTSEPEDGSCLACIAEPKSNLSLDA